MTRHTKSQRHIVTDKPKSKRISLKDFLDAELKPCAKCGCIAGLIVYSGGTPYLECDGCFTLRDTEGNSYGLLSDLGVGNDGH